MADELNTETMKDEDWDDLLEVYEPEVENAEKGMDDAITKLAKNQRKLAEKQQKMEAQAERERIVEEFYKDANDTEKELADVFLAGVTDPDKVKKMVDLAKSKAKALAGDSDEPAEDADEDEGDDDALSAPVQTSAMRPKDKRKELAEKARAGDVHASFTEFMDAPATAKLPQ
jgi:hypothetical protein